MTVAYVELAKRLTGTPSRKPRRFAAIFLLACLAALEPEGIRLMGISKSGLQPMIETNDSATKTDSANPFPPTMGKSDHSTPPEHENKASIYVEKTRDFFTKYVWRWVARTIRWINTNSGVVTAVATAVIAVLTWSISEDSKKQAGAAISQFGIMQSQLREMVTGAEQVERAVNAANRQAEAMEYANRAWIAVAGIDVDGLWENGKETSIKVSFVNTGREVATSVRNHVRFLRFRVNKDYKFGETVINAGQNLTCSGALNEDGGSLAFPDNKRENSNNFRLGLDLLDASVFDGDYALVMQGCISYLSSKVFKMTGYCFVVGQGNNHVTAAKSPWCGDGNFTN